MASILSTITGLIKGLVFCFYLFFTTFFGSIFIMGPAYPLLFIKQSWFRCFMDRAMSLWLWLPGALFEYAFGVKIILSGDRIDPKDCPLIIMNHRCRLDWMFYWMGLQRFGRLSNEKIIMKHELKLIPGPGWAMQNAMFIFLKRRWEQDEGYLTRLLDYFIDIKYPLQLFLFPEGTNMCDEALKRSRSYAEKNGLVQYDYTLHPRVTGFNFIVQKLRGKLLHSIHDVTVGYLKDECFGEMDLVFGNFPSEIHLNLKKYTMDEIPVETAALNQWCIDTWAAKESRLKQFHIDGVFEPKNVKEETEDKKNDNNCFFIMKFVLLFWTLFLVFSFYAVYQSSLAFWYMIIMTVFYVTITILGNGTDELQLNMHELRNPSFKQE